MLLSGLAGVTANNYTLIRFADVILWLAECEVEAKQPGKSPSAC